MERMVFETREQEEHYVAMARGFGSVGEMRDFFAANPRKPAQSRTSNLPGLDDYCRRLAVLKLSECN